MAETPDSPNWSLDRVLVPTDGSDCASNAVDYAIALAEQFGAAVTLLTVVDERRFENAEAAGHEQDAATALVTDAAERVRQAEVAVETTVRVGQPAEEIVAAADEIQADIVVMGTHGRSGVERLLIGSVADGVIRRSEIPVLAVPPEATVSTFGNVLVATDGGRVATRAVDLGLLVAGAFDGTLHAISVVEPTGLGTDVRSAEFYEVLSERAEGAVEAAAERATAAGVDVTTAIEYGRPANRVNTYSEEHDIGLVVMGTHGRSGLDRLLLGSVAEKTLRLSTVPVVVVPPESDE